MGDKHIAKVDEKFVPVDAEPGFSPERNKRIIEGSIKKYDIMRAKKLAEWKEKIGERSDALVSFFKSMKFGTKPAEKYFGKRGMAYLRGEQIIDEIFSKRIQTDTMGLLKKNLKTK